MSTTPSDQSSVFSTLGSRRFALLTTFHNSGAGVATPMWFVRRGGFVYMATAGNAGKLRRIERNPVVTIAPCRSQGRPLGPPARATATILDPAEGGGAARALARRYFLPRFVIEAFFRRRGGGVPPVYLRLTPAAAPDPEAMA